jgi:NAD(P)-dependent dehydrogenase (short-subunit alcohol dehydrogenase family)
LKIVMAAGNDLSVDGAMNNRTVEKCLAGQKALVTDGRSGIGRGIALALGATGAHVVVNYHSPTARARSLPEFRRGRRPAVFASRGRDQREKLSPSYVSAEVQRVQHHRHLGQQRGRAHCETRCVIP